MTSFSLLHHWKTCLFCFECVCSTIQFHHRTMIVKHEEATWEFIRIYSFNYLPSKMIFNEFCQQITLIWNWNKIYHWLISSMKFKQILQNLSLHTYFSDNHFDITMNKHVETVYWLWIVLVDECIHLSMDKPLPILPYLLVARSLQLSTCIIILACQSVDSF